MTIRILDVGGSPADMGRAHAEAAGDALRRFAADRVALAGDPEWSGRALSRGGVLALAEACIEPHRAYSPALTAELAGMAESAGLTLAEMIVVNGFTDFIDTVYAAAPEAPAWTPAAPPPIAVDDCTAFLVPASRTRSGRSAMGQTWDMHASAEEHVIVLRGAPHDAPAFVTFTTFGCVGMIGMNEHGLAVGITNLSGADGRVGVTWPFVVREVLRERDVEGGLRRILGAPLAGAHSYQLMDAAGRGVNVEATATTSHVTELGDDAVVQTNHCMASATLERQRPRDPVSQASSERRRGRALELLDRDDLDVSDLEALTRDAEAICYRIETPRPLATCGAVVMESVTKTFRAVSGSPREGSYASVTVRARP
jgi:isopenicillin-N N-acyltransferase like protein